VRWGDDVRRREPESGDGVRVGSNLDHPLQRSGISRGSSTRHIMVERGMDGKRM
jgi:hypothetical protein